MEKISEIIVAISLLGLFVAFPAYFLFRIIAG